MILNTEILKKAVSDATYTFFQEEIRRARIIGLGTGSTVKFLIKKLIEENILQSKQVFVSSLDIKLFIERYGVKPYLPFELNTRLNIYIDGFDEASYNLDLVKGRGGAFYWEKILAKKARLRIYIADYTKWNNKPYLYLKPIPIEVSRNKLVEVYGILNDMSLKPVIRMGRSRDGPVITDSGNHIIDIKPGIVYHPEKLENEILKIDGVIDTGIFTSKLVDYVIIAGPNEHYIKIYGGGRTSY